MISPSSIQQVLNRADIIDIVGQFIRLRKRGTSHIANCPFHNEKTPSFHVSGAKGIYKCFGCGKGGNVVTFIQEHEKLTYPEAIRWIADYYKITLEESERTPEQQQQQLAEESLRILNEFAATYFQHTLTNTEEGQTIGLSYFKQRGFRKDIIERFRLGYNPEGFDAFYKAAQQKGYNAELLEKAGLIKDRNGNRYDVYRGRVIFPIQSMTGRVLGFGARILKSNEKAPKYINTPENELYNKSRVLYGMYQSRAAIGKQDECFLVEGYTDVISLHQGGVENVVASSGTSLTEDQLRVIGQLTKNLTILYDGDAAGIKAALRGLDMALSQSFNVQLVLLPAGEDPDSFVQKSGASGFHEYVKGHKQDVISFRLGVGMAEVANDPVKKSKLVNEVAESISKINKAEDFALQAHYIREAARKLDVEEQGFVNLVNKYIREKIEQSEKKVGGRKGEPQPDPQEYEQYEQYEQEQYGEPAAQAKPKGDEKQEWEIVRVLLEFGDKPIEGFDNVAAMMNERVDPDLIETPLARMIYDQYFNYLNNYQTLPTVQYFINYPDEQVQRQMATLLQSKADLSHNWKDTYGIETFHGEDGYVNEVESAMRLFEIKKLFIIQDHITNALRTEKDPQKVEMLVRRLMELRNIEKDLTIKYGTVTYRISRAK